MAEFGQTLEDCNFVDIGFIGARFTWERRNLPNTNIRERLDRCVANDGWFRLFLYYRMSHLAHSISDHCPLLLTDGRSKTHTAKRFRFEVAWTMEESFKDEVARLWGLSNASLFEKLEILATGLLPWARF